MFSNAEVEVRVLYSRSVMSSDDQERLLVVHIAEPTHSQVVRAMFCQVLRNVRFPNMPGTNALD
jgi:hypothetical protein